MLLIDCKTLEDIEQWGRQYMHAKQFMLIATEVEGQWMKFIGVRFLNPTDPNLDMEQAIKEDLDDEESPHEFTAFKVNITTYMPDYIPEKPKPKRKYTKKSLAKGKNKHKSVDKV